MPEPPAPAPEQTNPYQIALRQLGHVAQLLKLEDGLYAILQKPT